MWKCTWRCIMGIPCTIFPIWVYEGLGVQQSKLFSGLERVKISSLIQGWTCQCIDSTWKKVSHTLPTITSLLPSHHPNAISASATILIITFARTLPHYLLLPASSISAIASTILNTTRPKTSPLSLPSPLLDPCYQPLTPPFVNIIICITIIMLLLSLHHALTVELLLLSFQYYHHYYHCTDSIANTQNGGG